MKIFDKLHNFENFLSSNETQDELLIFYDNDIDIVNIINYINDKNKKIIMVVSKNDLENYKDYFNVNLMKKMSCIKNYKNISIEKYKNNLLVGDNIIEFINQQELTNTFIFLLNETIMNYNLSILKFFQNKKILINKNILTKNVHVSNEINFFCNLSFSEKLFHFLFIESQQCITFSNFISQPFYYLVDNFLKKNYCQNSKDLFYSIYFGNKIFCCICFEVIKYNVGITFCHHYFCYECLIKSLNMNKKCPKCRRIINHKSQILKHTICDFDNNFIGTKLTYLIKYITENQNKKFFIIINNDKNNDGLREIFAEIKKCFYDNSAIIDYKKFNENDIVVTSKFSKIKFEKIITNKQIIVIFIDQMMYKLNKKQINYYNFLNCVNFIINDTCEYNTFISCNRLSV